MRDPGRIPEVLNALWAYWIKHPDLRLGQIVSNASSQHRSDPDPYYLEDEDLMTSIADMACPVCRDRPVVSKCHGCGRE